MPENRDGQSSMDNAQYEESSGGSRGAGGGGDKCDQVKQQIMQIAKSGDMENLVKALKQAIEMKCITEQEAQSVMKQAQGGAKGGGKGKPQ
tara:strand:+ start:40839 stop:41111 length:273 start_codon:yes stop_codon:yes gene_type:complete